MERNHRHPGRWATVLAISAGLWTSGSGPDRPVVETPPAPSPAVVPVPRDPATGVQAEMRNVHFQVAKGVILDIARLRGRLLATDSSRPPTLDDKQSFVLDIESAEISIDTASLGNLLTDYVFAYRGSPIGSVRVSTEAGQLIQRGRLHGLPFSMRADVTLTPAGLIRLRPRSVKVAGIGMRGLMGFFGLTLEKLAKIDAGHGVRLDGDDFFLDPVAILPPPRIRGRVTKLLVRDGMVVQTFGAGEPPARLASPAAGRANYMFFKGATLRFGKLTMSDTDLLILDDDPTDPFNFFLDRYNEQLVAGYSKNTPDHGLIVRMPDLEDMKKGIP